MSNLKYRADIDGLRAIAVLMVVLFHMNADWIPGGFIGVDIFFVISGYIITSAIYPQIVNKEFSFNQFYVKRIKRILPLFYLVAMTSLVLHIGFILRMILWALPIAYGMQAHLLLMFILKTLRLFCSNLRNVAITPYLVIIDRRTILLCLADGLNPRCSLPQFALFLGSNVCDFSWIHWVF